MSRPAGTYDTRFDEDMAIIRTRFQWALLGCGLILAFCLPLFSNDYWMGVVNFICIYTVAALGLNLLMGYCGQVSLGHAAFVGVGAFTSAVLVIHLGWPFLATIPMAGLIAGLIGLVFGLPSLRLKEFYLAMATLAAQFIIVLVLGHAFPHILGGDRGLYMPRPIIAGVNFDTNASVYYIILPVTLLMIFFAKNIARTRLGRNFVAIRDNDLAAELTGISIFRYKLYAFFIGCFFAGVAGSLWALFVSNVNNLQFGLMESIWYVGIIIVGGMGTTIGAVFGTIFIRLLHELTSLVIGPFLQQFVTGIALARVVPACMPIIFGLVLVLFLIFEPRGVAHLWEMTKGRVRHWPFTYG